MHLALNTLPLPAVRPVQAMLRALHKALQRQPAVPRDADTNHELDKREIVALLEPRGSRIECLKGCVWITRDSGQSDVLVDAGQSFQADGAERVLVYALEKSSVRVTRR